jgi:hypothetical protein
MKRAPWTSPSCLPRNPITSLSDSVQCLVPAVVPASVVHPRQVQGARVSVAEKLTKHLRSIRDTKTLVSIKLSHSEDSFYSTNKVFYLESSISMVSN